jgi:hypothetical protein
MTTTLKDIEQAIASWQIGRDVSVVQVGSRARLTVDGETADYPMWLALRKVNQIGAERGI